MDSQALQDAFAVDLQQKTWLIPFIRTIAQTTSPLSGASSEVTQPSTHTLDRWQKGALQERGFFTGFLTLRGAPPKAASKKGPQNPYKQGRFLFLNTLHHQIELLLELMHLLHRHSDQLSDQLALLIILAGHVGAMSEAEQIVDFGLEEWGGADDPKRQELTTHLTPALAHIGKRLKSFALHPSNHPVLRLPFYRVLTYIDTQQLLAIARLYLRQGTQRLPQEATAKILAHHSMQKVYILEVLMNFALLDGRFSPLERHILQNILDFSRLPQEEQQRIWDTHRHPTPLHELTPHLDDPLTNHFLYQQVLLHCFIEESQPTPKERDFLERLAQALDIQQAKRLRLEAATLAFLQQNPSLPASFTIGQALTRYKDHLQHTFSSILHDNMELLLQEVKETKELYQLLCKRAQGPLTPEEEQKVYTQLLDICKSIPPLTVFSMPGGTVLFPLMLHLLPSRLLPSAFADPNPPLDLLPAAPSEAQDLEETKDPEEAI